MTTILTYAQAAARLGCTVRSIRRRVERGELPWAYTGRRTGRWNRREKGIPQSAVQAVEGKKRGGHNGSGRAVPPRACGQPAPPQTDDARARESDLQQLPLIHAGTPVLARRPDHLPQHIPITRDGIPDLPAMRQMGLGNQVAEYERRFRAVSRLRNRLAEAAHGERLAVRRRVAEEVGCGVRTLRAWHDAVEHWGWAGLMPAYGKSRGVHRAIPRELQRQILDAYTYQGRLSVAQIYERVVRPFIANDGCQLPHPSTIRNFLKRNVPPIVKTASREGVRAYQEQHEAKVRRDLEAAGVNGWWVSDHRLGDTMVLVPDGKGTGWPSKVHRALCPCGSGALRRDCCSVRRIWWTVTCDVCSGAFVGWRFSLQPNAATVCHHLRQAILDFGLPEHWMRDNGKEFTANRLDGPTLDMDVARKKGRAPALMPPEVESSTVWEQLGVRVVTALPYSSWSKYIESLFGAFSRRYENLLPGWTANRSSRRPEKLKLELIRGELLTIDEYVDRIGAMVGEWNSDHPVGERRQPPAAYYKDFLPRRVDAQTLGFLLQDRRQVKVRQGGLVLDGHHYVSGELAKYSGVRADVLWDPQAPDWIYVYPGDGRCIAVAETPAARYGEWGEANRCIADARRAQRRFIREWSAPIKGACPPERMDPFGAHQAVQTRIARLPAVAAQAQEARRRAVARLEEPEALPAPKRRRTIYSEPDPVDDDGVVRLAE